MREMIDRGQIDVLTGDYLAELTMLILGRDRARDSTRGYARTFLRQVEDSLGPALEQGIRIVANAGGVNPAGLAHALADLAERAGLDTKIAYVDGDDLVQSAPELGLGEPLTANAYLGGFGIASALSRGADIVVTGRVTDASLVVGPAVAHFGWGRTEFDALAGAVVAGHVIECGAQATGGNFSGFTSLLGDSAPPSTPPGFPIAEIRADGSSVITKHDDTSGAVTVDTVTAQLFYEIQGPSYLGPDVSVCLDSIVVAQESVDRVNVSAARGEPAPASLKVCINEHGGFRNEAELLLVGLDIEQKAAWVQAQVDAALALTPPASLTWSLARTDREDADTEEAATARLRCVVKDPAEAVAGKAFTEPIVGIALSSYPGFFLAHPPSRASSYGVYRAAYVPQETVDHVVHHHDGTEETIPAPEIVRPVSAIQVPTPPRLRPAASPGPSQRLPIGCVVHARSGDKGGSANIGLWAVDASSRPDRVEWLLDLVTPDFVRRMIPEAADLDVEVHPLPNLGGTNVVIHGLLGEAAAATTRFDPQAKGLAEWFRSRHVDIPEVLI